MERSIAKAPLICSTCSDDVYPGEDYLKVQEDDGHIAATCVRCAENMEVSWELSAESAEANGDDYEEEDDYETMPAGWVGLDFGED